MITRGIFKANGIRGVTEGPDPQWDTAGAYAIGAAVAAPVGRGLDRGSPKTHRGDFMFEAPVAASSLADQALPAGQDAALAADFARRYATVGAMVAGLRHEIAAHVAQYPPRPVPRLEPRMRLSGLEPFVHG